MENMKKMLFTEPDENIIRLLRIGGGGRLVDASV